VGRWLCLSFPCVVLVSKWFWTVSFPWHWTNTLHGHAPASWRNTHKNLPINSYRTPPSHKGSDRHSKYLTSIALLLTYESHTSHGREGCPSSVCACVLTFHKWKVSSVFMAAVLPGDPTTERQWSQEIFCNSATFWSFVVDSGLSKLKCPQQMTDASDPLARVLSNATRKGTLKSWCKTWSRNPNQTSVPHFISLAVHPKAEDKFEEKIPLHNW
jgi:hypothetical protein